MPKSTIMKPYISIITTTYNSEDYLEQTLQSIYHQKDANYTHIIVDGDSKDSTHKILKKYKDNIGQLIIEPDDGMYHGITKGAEYAETEIMGWLNSDDIYYPWTLSVVEQVFKKYPTVDWIIGQPSYINEKGHCIKVSSNSGSAYPNYYIRNGWFQPLLAGYLQQESMFWRKSLWDKAGGLDLKYKYAADFDLWTRFARHADLVSVSLPLASFRKRPGQTSIINEKGYSTEVVNICSQFSSYPKLWSSFSKIHNYFRIVARLLIWKKCKVITYSEKVNDWILKEKFRPLSRYSLTELLLEV